VILYQPRPDLTDAERARFMAALRRAISEIPTVKKARVGTRRLLGVAYESAMQPGFDHFAVIEFEDENGLRTYLDHPAHAALGEMFWACSSRTLVFDYELTDAQNAH
jgi:Stress responsive A/B Barrel Domain